MTSTLTTPVVDVDVDLDAEVPCAIRNALVNGHTGEIISEKKCENAAKWAGNYPCCGKTTLLCDDHATDTVGFLCAPCRRKFSVTELIGMRRL